LIIDNFAADQKIVLHSERREIRERFACPAHFIYQLPVISCT